MTDTTSLDLIAKTHGLILDAASPITARSYVNVPGVQFSEVRRYTWPKKANGSRYDKTVLVAVYADGSFGTYVESTL